MTQQRANSIELPCALCAGASDLLPLIRRTACAPYKARRAELKTWFQQQVGWRTLRGQGGRHREWLRVLRDMERDDPGIRAPAGPPRRLQLPGLAVVTLTGWLHLHLDELYGEPRLRRERHAKHAPEWMRPIFEEAKAALATPSREDFLRLKPRAVERAIARLLGHDAGSWRAVRRAYRAWIAAARAGDIHALVWGSRRREREAREAVAGMERGA